LPPLPTHTSAHRDHNKITTATTTTTTTTTDERKETTLVGSISTSLDRSGRARPSPLAGCLAPSPPARSIELSAVSFAFNKNLAQMAVAKSAEFHGAGIAGAYVEESFGDASSSDSDSDAADTDGTDLDDVD